MQVVSRLWRGRSALALFPRWGGASVTAAVVLFAGLAVGYGYLLAQHDRPQPAGAVADLSALCGQPRRYVASQAPYAGTGPHPIVVYEQRKPAGHAARRVPYSDPDWQGSPFDAYGPHAVQLVACSKRVYAEPTQRRCRFEEGKPVQLYHAGYRVEVLEARTARKISDVVLWPSAVACPRAGAVLDERASRVFSVPTAEDYADALMSFGVEPVRPTDE
ncbi:hypothetical protein ACFVJ4_37380 [Streptomyces sp. NPDC127178]|uniref:hypothetical protein n=1 Tax=unclassified Streptomyces TaxID=2593676 RepID=UPI0036404D91